MRKPASTTSSLYFRWYDANWGPVAWETLVFVEQLSVMAIHTFLYIHTQSKSIFKPCHFFLRLPDNFWSLRRPNIIGTSIEPGLPSSTSFRVQVPLDRTQCPAMKIQKSADEITELPIQLTTPSQPSSDIGRRSSNSRKASAARKRSHKANCIILDIQNRYRYGDEEAPVDGSEQPY